LPQLRQLARAALAAYEIGEVHLDLLHSRTNTIYRVTLRDRTRFVLRIHSPQTPTAHIRSELIWLDALHDDGFTFPHAIRDRQGNSVITLVEQASRPVFAGATDCTLLTWVEGRLALKKRTPQQVRLIGRQMALLHGHAARFRAPQGFARPSWDPESLLDNETWQRLTSSQSRLFAQVAESFASVSGDLGRGNEVFGLIHGDFTFDNVLFHRGDAGVIDFDDCAFGYYLHDIATLLDRMEWREDYAALRTALILGYREERALPPEHEALLDLFLLVRWTFLGLAFLSAPDHSPGRTYSSKFLNIVVPKIRKYLRTPAVR